MDFIQVKLLGESIGNNISKVIRGKDEIIKLVITSLLCSGNVLLEDVPGVGKTVLAKSLAKSINCTFKRIQFTPDLLPTDMTGVNIFNQKTGEFGFLRGPIFSNILLADEINRATPRTQSSLLECMEEHQVTIDGQTRVLSKPFFVIATQNSVETQGTFPLPEAQLDRFLMRLSLGYPSRESSLDILNLVESGHPYDRIGSVCDKEELVKAQEMVFKVRVSENVKKYILDIVDETRKSNKVSLGVSPRGTISLLRATQAYSAVEGRDYSTPDDVKKVVVNVLSHRIIKKGYSIDDDSSSSESIIKEIINSVQVPIENIGLGMG